MVESLSALDVNFRPTVPAKRSLYVERIEGPNEVFVGQQLRLTAILSVRWDLALRGKKRDHLPHVRWEVGQAGGPMASPIVDIGGPQFRSAVPEEAAGTTLLVSAAIQENGQIDPIPALHLVRVLREGIETVPEGDEFQQYAYLRHRVIINPDDPPKSFEWTREFLVGGSRVRIDHGPKGRDSNEWDEPRSDDIAASSDVLGVGLHEVKCEVTRASGRRNSFSRTYTGVEVAEPPRAAIIRRETDALPFPGSEQGYEALTDPPLATERPFAVDHKWSWKRVENGEPRDEWTEGKFGGVYRPKWLDVGSYLLRCEVRWWGPGRAYSCWAYLLETVVPLNAVLPLALEKEIQGPLRLEDYLSILEARYEAARRMGIPSRGLEGFRIHYERVREKASKHFFVWEAFDGQRFRLDKISCEPIPAVLVSREAGAIVPLRVYVGRDQETDAWTVLDVSSARVRVYSGSDNRTPASAVAQFQEETKLPKGLARYYLSGKSMGWKPGVVEFSTTSALEEVLETLDEVFGYLMVGSVALLFVPAADVPAGIVLLAGSVYTAVRSGVRLYSDIKQEDVAWGEAQTWFDMLDVVALPAGFVKPFRFVVRTSRTGQLSGLFSRTSKFARAAVITGIVTDVGGAIVVGADTASKIQELFESNDSDKWSKLAALLAMAAGQGALLVLANRDAVFFRNQWRKLFPRKITTAIDRLRGSTYKEVYYTRSKYLKEEIEPRRRSATLSEWIGAPGATVEDEVEMAFGERRKFQKKLEANWRYKTGGREDTVPAPVSSEPKYWEALGIESLVLNLETKRWQGKPRFGGFVRIGGSGKCDVLAVDRKFTPPRLVVIEGKGFGGQSLLTSKTLETGKGVLELTPEWLQALNSSTKHTVAQDTRAVLVDRIKNAKSSVEHIELRETLVALDRTAKQGFELSAYDRYVSFAGPDPRLGKDCLREAARKLGKFHVYTFETHPVFGATQQWIERWLKTNFTVKVQTINTVLVSSYVYRLTGKSGELPFASDLPSSVTSELRLIRDKMIREAEQSFGDPEANDDIVGRLVDLQRLLPIDLVDSVAIGTGAALGTYEATR